MAEVNRIYWDADVFLSLINDYPDRAPIIEAILDGVRLKKNVKIVTSVISRVEVAWAAIEQTERALSDDEEKGIDLLLGNQAVVNLVDFNDTIALRARQFMREGMERGGKKLRTNDAIHLASADWVAALELNTYNLKDYEFFQPLVSFPIREPMADQPRLL